MRIERLSMSTFTELQEQIFNLPERGELSDGYHSFNELYYHRMILFSIICKQSNFVEIETSRRWHNVRKLFRRGD